jgi:hypothetical protein
VMAVVVANRIAGQQTAHKSGKTTNSELHKRICARDAMSQGPARRMAGGVPSSGLMASRFFPLPLIPLG